MWMNNPLGVMQIKWQIEEGDRLIAQAHLSKADAFSFPERLYLINRGIPEVAASWLWGVSGSQGRRKMNGRRAEGGMAQGSSQG